MVNVKKAGGAFQPVYTPPLEYLGGQSYTMDATSQAVTIPAGAQYVFMRADGGDAYYAINAAFAQASSPGYLPQSYLDMIPYIVNLNSLHLWGAATVVVHVMFYRDSVA